MKKSSRGLIGYLVMIAAFVLLAVLLSGGGESNGHAGCPAGFGIDPGIHDSSIPGCSGSNRPNTCLVR